MPDQRFRVNTPSGRLLERVCTPAGRRHTEPPLPLPLPYFGGQELAEGGIGDGEDLLAALLDVAIEIDTFEVDPATLVFQNEAAPPPGTAR